MAKVTVVKAPKVKPVVTQIENDDEGVGTPVEKTSPVETADEAPEAPPEPPKAAVKPPTVAIKKSRQDLVPIVMMKTVEPPPVIGHCNVGAEFGVSKLQAGKSYSLPRNVSEVLIDAKAATALQQ
jgi:hypothetical protein